MGGGLVGGSFLGGGEEGGNAWIPWLVLGGLISLSPLFFSLFRDGVYECLPPTPSKRICEIQTVHYTRNSFIYTND